VTRRDPRIDAYIAKAPEFARPILEHIRETVHATCPECEETLKWSSPTFTYHGILCGMAAFKEHAMFGFWKWQLVLGEEAKYRDGAGSYGKLTSVKDLPPKKELQSMIRKAMELNEKGVTQPRKSREKKAIAMPAVLRAALAKNTRAKTSYDAFSPSAKREYLEWIVDAKTDETRDRRVKQAVEWMAEGKQRNWKYQ
jgi:uncharacterized protein YdeI (YjbR/CyaY-like superfamily)